MSLRPATPADAPAVTALIRAAYEVFTPRLGREPPPMADDYAAVIVSGAVQVWEEAGEILGLIVLRAADDAVLIENLAVSPAAQGRGLGRKLIAAAEAEAVAQGVSRLYLFTHTAMQETVAFYHRLGFVEVAEADPKPQRIAMERPVERGYPRS